MTTTRIQSILTLITLLAFFTSCFSVRELPDTTIKSIDGIKLVENSKEKITIRYFGDYWFHKLTEKLTLNWNDSYIASFKSHKPKTVYCAHTTVEPYCTSAGFAYDKIKGENMVEIIFSDLKKKFQLANYNSSIIKVNGIEVTKVSYEIQNKKLKITTLHNEFFLESTNKIIRIIFWTTETSGDWFNRETANIINTIKSGT